MDPLNSRTRHLPLLVLPLLLIILGLACAVPFNVTGIATATPTLTATPTSSPTPTEIPTPTPTPTPLPAARIELGEQDLFLGNFEEARKQYVEAQSAAPDDETRIAALIGTGRSLYLERNYSTAIKQFESVLQTYPTSPQAPYAWFYLAQSYELTQQYALAAQAYGKYIELSSGVLNGYVYEWQGDALFNAADYLNGAKAYEQALTFSRPGNPAWLRLKQAEALENAQDYTNAVILYLDIYQTADNDFAKARANYQLGQTYLSLAEPEQAYARFLDSVNLFPTSYDTYLGLVELVNNGVPVSDLDRGIIDYYAGQYGLAVEALTRYLDSGQSGDGTTLYYRALSHLEWKEPGFALEDLDALIEQYPADRFLLRAYRERAYTQWAYLDQYEAAAQGLLSYVELFPTTPEAPDLLYEAARILERGGQLAQAATVWQQMMDTYPTAEMSPRGLFLAGISQYRLADYAQARTIFQRMLILATQPGDQAAALLWVGKTFQTEGNDAEATRSWEQAAQRDPTGYYSERAQELLAGIAAFEEPPAYNLEYDLNTDRSDAEAWLRTTFNLAADTNLADITTLQPDPAFQRGMELHKLGLFSQARDEFEAVRLAVASDPAQTFRLMNTLLEKNYYRSAILASRQILDLAGMDDATTLTAPAYFNHIRFGVYYRDLVLPNALDREISPLYLLSVIRQESLFEPFAVSGANARGLMQIVPATGQEIVAQINWPPNYDVADLNRPNVSITLGAQYLARQRDYFDGSLYTALAAYNGGPGNTMIWNELAGGDPDLLLEVIRADETRKYIMQIFEFYNIYQGLYRE
jgi:soluble lytic murein transglycosylase